MLWNASAFDIRSLFGRVPPTIRRRRIGLMWLAFAISVAGRRRVVRGSPIARALRWATSRLAILRDWCAILLCRFVRHGQLLASQAAHEPRQPERERAHDVAHFHGDLQSS